MHYGPLLSLLCGQKNLRERVKKNYLFSYNPINEIPRKLKKNVLFIYMLIKIVFRIYFEKEQICDKLVIYDSQCIILSL